MTLERFVAERQSRWAELEAAVKRARRGRLRGMPAQEIERFGLLLRHAASDLAIARRDHPDAEVTAYLNGLCTRAHPMLYRGTPMRLSALGEFFARGLPRAFRDAWPYVVGSLVLLAIGFLAGFIAVSLRPDLRSSLIPQSLFDEMARGQIKTNVMDPGWAGAFIITNNIKVALICFAGGVLLGLPTALELLANGWMLGTIAAAVNEGGYNLAFWSLIAPHGVIELSVIVIAGGTGLMLGVAILRPGKLRRGDALVGAARRAVLLALGVAVLLIIAGTIEAFVSPSTLPNGVKLAIGAGSGLLLYSWLLLSGRKRARRRAGRSLETAQAAA
ncbi:MAG: stage II sporulation protein M [Candidatus Dormibacteraeota bacterium]|nr:stage II sporulation protein M [Candidatus Dormibacteraeota bacterium]